MTDENQQNKDESQDSSILLQKKYEAAKEFVQDLDNKVTDLTAQNTTLSSEVLTLKSKLESYEALGPVEDLLGKLSKDESQEVNHMDSQKKNESEDTSSASTTFTIAPQTNENADGVKCNACGSTSLLLVDGGKYQCQECPNIQDKQELPDTGTETGTDGQVKNETDQEKSKMESDQIELLEKYKSLGTPEELAEKIAALAKADANLSEANETANIAIAKLESYVAIGTVSEILGVVQEFDTMRTKQESELLAADYGVTVDAAAKAISKMESVKDAREFFEELGYKPKTEAEKKVTDNKQDEQKEKNESDKTNQTQQKDKNESGEDVLAETHKDSKQKNESARMSHLSTLIDKM